MADVLKHLEKVPAGRQTEWWTPRSYTTVDAEPYKIDVDYLERYRLQLLSQVGFAVHPTDNRAVDMAMRTARRQLVNHLYGQQLDIAHDLLHALYAGETREKVAERVLELIESMTER